MNPDRIAVRRAPWQRRAEQAERELRRAKGALRLSQAVYRVLRQASGEAALPAQVCAALVEAGCPAVAWLVPGEPVLLRSRPGAELDGARLVRWSRAWDAMAAELVAVAAPLADPFAPLGGGWAGCLILPLREGSHFFGALAVALGEEAGPDGEAAVEQAMASVALVMAARQAQAALVYQEADRQRHEAQFARLMSSIDNAVWTLSARTGRWVYLNEAFERICGRPAAEFMRNKRLWREIIHPEDLAGLVEWFSKPCRPAASGRVFRVLRPDGAVRWVEGSKSALRDAQGRVSQFMGVAADITERMRYEASVAYLATRDGLTGLPNRHVLVGRASQALAGAQSGRGGLALGVLNLDGLKLINHSMGHEAGDALLVAVAQRLLAVVRGRDAVARLGGDEFAILFAETPCADAVAALGDEVLACFASPFTIGGHELHLSASLGVAVYPDDGDSTAALLKHAHSALHSAKQEGGACCRFYTRRMSADAVERIRLDQALRGAAERHEFELHYQPQIDLRSGCIAGLEALVRWRHPELGLISPARFIPLAEQTGQIVSLGEWVMRSACAQMVAWQKAGLAPRRIAVNLSARQLWQGDMAERVARLLRETGIEAGALELEITESVVMRDIAETVRALSALRALGVALSLDDFGTGYSSLSYLRSLPINKLKIDRSFVHDVTTHADVALLVQQIINIGHAFKLGVVAEGVETREAVDFLARSGCDEAQGFYFGRPLPAPQMEVLLRQHFRRPPSSSVVEP